VLFAVLNGFLGTTLAVLLLYAVREYIYTFARLASHSLPDQVPFDTDYLPPVSVLIPMHNEEKVAGDILDALVDADYPPDRLQVLPINDRSTDRTAQLINSYSVRYPMIHPIHRVTGSGNKASALDFAGSHATGDILIFFDADYVPGRSLLKLLVAPFIDASVGAVMGRVVPLNTGESILASLISQERAAGYQVQQQARHILGLIPQFGGTAGGIRASALRSVGGWNTASLTEDTDMTCRLVLRGWRISYLNHAECYEEVPSSWRVRRKQLNRWIMGHTECLHTYAGPIIKCNHLTLSQKADALFMLGQYWTAPLMLGAWLVTLLLTYSPVGSLHPIWHCAEFVVACQMFGNQAPFVQIGSAAVLDRSSEQVRLLPLQILNFFASTLLITQTLGHFYMLRLFGRRPIGWHKTARTRQGL
jgi:cellulose synthase/poly-beta-1,6-N-acetylglucosamine synthase-like glycosyltransferase